MGKEFHDQYIYRHANGYVRVFCCCVRSPMCCNLCVLSISLQCCISNTYTSIHQLFYNMLLCLSSFHVVLRSIRIS